MRRSLVGPWGIVVVSALGFAEPSRGAGSPAGDHLAAPVSLTASDGTGLRIVSFQARAVLQGPLAFTELHLVFRNPQARALEGQFAITLPPGAAVSRFAMRQAWGWQEGEVVERQAARVAYESFLHRRVDPALLEKQAGNEFRARVFPIAASAEKQIIISYSQELVATRDPYRLALRGLPRLDALDIRVLGGKREAAPASTNLGGTAVTQHVIEVSKRDFQPDADLEVPLPSGVGGLRHGTLAVARVAPLDEGAADRPAELLVLYDTSASRALGFGKQVERLRTLVAEMARSYGAQTPLRVACFDQEVADLFVGTLGGFGAKQTQTILERRPLGASDLGRALDWVASLKDRRWSRIVVVTDGVATAGATEGNELRKKVTALAAAGVQRLDVVTVGGIRDQIASRALARAGLPRAGAVLEEELSVAEVARRIGAATAPPIKVSVPGATWVWPERLEGIQAGDQVLVYADLPVGRPLEVVLEGARPLKQLVPAVEVARPLLERAWVAARIERLMHQRDTLAASDPDLRAALRTQIVEISTRHRVLCDFTALLVLETERDYARFKIDRRALRDILVVGPSGLELMGRGELPGTALLTDSAAGVNTPPAPDGLGMTPGSAAAGGPDGDKDRIPDAVDRCPSEPETYNGMEDDDGCPDKGRVIVTRGKIEILDKIYFGTNQSDILPTNGPLLDAIAATLKGNPQLNLLEVQGHAGAREQNAVADDRAVAVVKALVDRGVDGGRLVAKSYGRSKPTCTVNNEDCRSQNRRVEFLILRRSEESPSDRVARVPPPPVPPAAGTKTQPAVVPDDGGAAAPAASERRYAAVIGLLVRRNVQPALKAAFAWRDEQPADLLALLALGEALEAVGNRRMAARAYGSIIDLFPGSAEFRRLAGGRLERVDSNALLLAVDSFRQARGQRPDHPSSHRTLAYALLRAGQPVAAFEAIAEAVKQRYPGGRFAGIQRVLRDDVGIIAAALIRSEPGRQNVVREQLKSMGLELATARSLRFVVTWESDANDVDLHIHDGRGGWAYYQSPMLKSGGELYADVTTGYGPECFALNNVPGAYPYRLAVNYYNRRAAGYGLGKLQVIEHDGSGKLQFDDRPFVLLQERGSLDLGIVRGPQHTAAR